MTRLLHAGALAALVGLVVLVYHPSLGHAHRGDQWCVLLDTLDDEGFLANFAHTHSYNRTRAVDPGDYQLYRPVLFMLLSAEKALFGNNLALWQAVGIALHLAAVGLFLTVLLETRRLCGNRGWAMTVLAYAVALFFALNFAGVEMVIWSHINGYLLFVVFALAAVRLCLPVLDPAGRPAGGGQLAAVFVLLLLGAFTYEIGSPFAVVAALVVGGALWARERRGRGVAAFCVLASVFPIYQGANVLDRWAHPGAWDANLGVVAGRAVSWPTVAHLGRYVGYTVVQPFFPSWAHWEFRGRVVVYEPDYAWPAGEWPGPLLAASLLVCAAGVLLALRGLANRPGRAVVLAAVLPASLFALHAAAVVLGRMNLRPGPVVLASNSYYAYLPLLAFLAVVYALWGCAAREGGGALACPTLVVGLVVLAGAGGLEVRRINVAVKNSLRPVRAATRTLARFIDAHAGERDFRLAVDPGCDWGETPHGVAFPIILFRRNINNHSPNYVFTLVGGRPEVVPAGAGGGQFCADLVRVDTGYNFFSFRGRYYGVPWKQGYYLPGRRDYEGLVVGRTLQDAVEQARAAHGLAVRVRAAGVRP
jgi:hypothetical protein